MRLHVPGAATRRSPRRQPLTLGDLTVDEGVTAAVEMGDGPWAWNGVLVVEGIETGDERIIEDGALDWDDLPLPVTVDHDGTVGMVIGRIDALERVDGQIRGTGILGDLDADSDNQRVARQVAELIAVGYVRGLSVELDMLEGEIVVEMPTDENGQPLDPDEPQDEIVIPLGGDLLRVTAARIRAVSVVQNAAFVDAQIALVDQATETTEGDEPEDDEPVAASSDGVTAGQVINGMLDSAPVGEAGPEWFTVTSTGANVVPFTAAADCAECPPRAAFDPPPPDADPRAIAVDGRRIYGFVALWGECHVGYPDECVTPPPSAAAYGYYLTGQIETAEGHCVPVGQITVGAGHASLGERDWRRARAHYDGGPGARQIADVTVGEDERGIWFSGVLRPDATADDVAALRAQALSGDWRPVPGGGGLELIALASVPNPGFPKVAARVADGAQVALIATAGRPDPFDELERRVARLEASQTAEPDRALAASSRLRRACTSRRSLADTLRSL